MKEFHGHPLLIHEEGQIPVFCIYADRRQRLPRPGAGNGYYTRGSVLNLRPGMRSNTAVCKARRRVQMWIHGALYAFHADEEVIRRDGQYTVGVQQRIVLAQKTLVILVVLLEKAKRRHGPGRGHTALL